MNNHIDIIVQSHNLKLDTKSQQAVGILSKAVTTIIQPQNLIFSGIFGSVAYNGISRNDIDFLVLTKIGISSFEKEQLIAKYQEAHEIAGLVADNEFPGEYITERQLKLAILGKGFYTDTSGHIITPMEIGANEWNDFNNFRHHLGAVSTSYLHLCGDIQQHMNYLLQATKSILYTMIGVECIEKGSDLFNKEHLLGAIIGSGKSFLGFSDSSSVTDKLLRILNKEISFWLESGIIQEEDTSYRIIDGGIFKRHLERIRYFNHIHNSST